MFNSYLGDLFLSSVDLIAELAELPLVRLDFSCNKVTSIPVCYRNLRHLQSIVLDNNPLQSPPAQVSHTHTHSHDNLYMLIQSWYDNDITTEDEIVYFRFKTVLRVSCVDIDSLI